MTTQNHIPKFGHELKSFGYCTQWGTVRNEFNCGSLEGNWRKSTWTVYTIHIYMYTSTRTHTHTHTHTLDNGMIVHSTLLTQLRSCDVLLPAFIHWFSTRTMANLIGKSSKNGCVFCIVLGLNSDVLSIGHTASLHFLIFNWIFWVKKMDFHNFINQLITKYFIFFLDSCVFESGWEVKRLNCRAFVSVRTQTVLSRRTKNRDY